MSTCTLINNFNDASPIYYQASSSKARFQPLPLAHQISIPIAFDSRALNYGDGVFSTIYAEFVDNSVKVQALNEHITRLHHDCLQLDILFDPKETEAYIIHACESFIADRINSQVAAPTALVIKVLVSRGSGGRGYEPPDDPISNIIISFFKGIFQQQAVDDETPQGYQVGLSELVLSENTMLAGLKHLNRLEQVLIKQEIKRKNWNDALVCKSDKLIVEASAANVFMLIDGCWITPPIKECGVRGVMRNLVINHFKEKQISFNEREIQANELSSIQSMFITNAVKGIQCVSHIINNEIGRELSYKAIADFKDEFLVKLQQNASVIVGEAL